MHKSPQVLSSIDFFGVKGKLILIEFDQLEDIKQSFHREEGVIVFTPNLNEIANDSFAAVRANAISKITRSIQQTCKTVSEININFVIHRIDDMDLDMDNKRRGSMRKGMLSCLPSRLLGGANVIITSTQDEYMLRELCDIVINNKQTIH